MEAAKAQTVLVAVEVELPPSTLARMSIWHLAVAVAVPAASAAQPVTSAPAVPVAAVAAAVPQVTLPGVYSGTLNGYYHAGAFGGDGGKNADGSTASDGADVELDNPKHADIQGVGLRSSDYTDDAGWENGNGRHDGGAGGAAGSASVGGSYGTVTVDWSTQEDDWNLVCLGTNSTRANWVHLNDNASTGKTLGAAGTTTYYYTARCISTSPPAKQLLAREPMPAEP